MAGWLVLCRDRLKGIGSSLLRSAVQSTAEKVELDGDPFRQPSSALSGGMRRRLSLGIALMGDPSIVVSVWVAECVCVLCLMNRLHLVCACLLLQLMDEPTTGLGE